MRLPLSRFVCMAVVAAVPWCASGGVAMGGGAMEVARAASSPAPSAAPLPPLQAPPADVQPQEAPSGLPLPRFVSLRSDAVNMRSGPGTRYPVVWIYKVRDLPVEVIAEYDNWRKIRDHEGSEGWVHQNMLAGRRFFVAREGGLVVRADPAPHARPVIRVGPGVIGRLMTCPKSMTFCRVDVAGHQGWLPRAGLWGIYREEVVD